MCFHIRGHTVTPRHTSDTYQHTHANIPPQLHPPTHWFTHKDRHGTHTRMHLCTDTHKNKDTHANAPLLSSAGGILTGFRFEPINPAMIHCLSKTLLLASISRHRNIIIRVLVHFAVDGSEAREHTVVQHCLGECGRWCALLPHDDPLKQLHKEKLSKEYCLISFDLGKCLTFLKFFPCAHIRRGDMPQSTR